MTLLNPFFGEFGGMYVPQILIPALLQLEKAFVDAKDDPAFVAEFQALLTEYAGRPTPPHPHPQFDQGHQDPPLPQA